MKVNHTLKPIYDSNSKVLILGSMPSVKSRELMFYYANPNNRFWKIFEILFNTRFNDVDGKIKFLLNNNIALWDTIKSCDIKSSYDSTIKNIEVNDINSLIHKTNIKYIFCTGNKSYEIYNKYIYDKTKIKPILLLSPSSANAKYNIDDLVNNYKIIKEKLSII